MDKNAIKFLAYYLPQFHPIPENDLWWGKGFTEWTNVTKAKPLFKGHYQPILPAELGFYDLRIPEVQEAQAKLALKYGIDGFIYYQYWFGDGKMLLEKPAEAMLKNNNILLPFCFCWANEDWKGIWHGVDSPDILIKQTYSGEKDYTAYFRYLLPFFKDERYIKVNNMPMFHIYKVNDIPDLDLFTKTFNDLAKQAGFNGVYLIGTIDTDDIIKSNPNIYGKVGVDIFNQMRYQQTFLLNPKSFLGKIERKLCKWFKIKTVKIDPFVLNYKDAIKRLEVTIPNDKYIPCVFPNWDNSARSGKKSMIFKNATPAYWGDYLKKVFEKVVNHTENPQFIVIKSWNEWAEGNYLEPDIKYGKGWLEVVKKLKDSTQST